MSIIAPMRAWAISAIVLVAIVMGMSSITPSLSSHINCPQGFSQASTFENPDREAKDKNGNGFVCIRIVGDNREIIIDDLPENAGGGEPPGGGGPPR